MELSFTTLTFMIVTALALAFWRDALRQRDVANAAAMEACERLALQFLDGTVAFARWRIQREGGRWLLRRVFVFDYTAQSIERRQGFVVMLGGRVESVGFATAEDAKPKQPPTPQPVVNITMTYGPTSSPPSAKILDMDEWRRTHQDRSRLQ
jgi:hypothetical protein